MKQYEVIVEVSECRKIMVDCEDYPTKEDVMRHLELNFPEWANDNESDYVLHSLGFEITSMKKVGD